ncbi:MAG: inorganic phosphate transporter [Buchnera aphidicola (Chaetogeoica yunlongensis)]
MLHYFSTVYFNHVLILCICLLCIFIYEAVNGFHDAANSIALVTYTRSTNEKTAILMSGMFNFFGVFFGGLSVAYAIIYLLPNNLLLNINTLSGLKAIFSILLSVILWNCFTWFMSLPTSSSHTLIGAIIGINVVNVFISHFSIFSLISLKKIIYVFLSLILSPIFGLVIAGSCVFLLKTFYCFMKLKSCINMSPASDINQDDKKSLFWIKLTLILSSLGISYFHGSNDGQKGIGLVMLVLICIFPSQYLINLNMSTYGLVKIKLSVDNLEKYYLSNRYLIDKNLSGVISKEIIEPLLFVKKIDCKKNSGILNIIDFVKNLLYKVSSYKELNVIQCDQLRKSLLCLGNFIDVLNHILIIKAKDKYFLCDLKKNLLKTIEYAPNWVIIFVALSLSVGTVIGWRRITNTFQNKLGRKEITYVQAISTQLTTAASVSLASYSGMPVSTTHIMFSSLVGTMLVNKSGVQIKTIKKIIITWLLTIPISIFLSSILYWISINYF